MAAFGPKKNTLTVSAISIGSGIVIFFITIKVVEKSTYLKENLLKFVRGTIDEFVIPSNVIYVTEMLLLWNLLKHQNQGIK